MRAAETEEPAAAEITEAPRGRAAPWDRGDDSRQTRHQEEGLPMRTAAEWAAAEWAAAPVAVEWDMDMVTTVEWGVEVVDDTVEDKTTRTKNLDRRSREPKVLKSKTD